MNAEDAFTGPLVKRLTEVVAARRRLRERIATDLEALIRSQAEESSIRTLLVIHGQEDTAVSLGTDDNPDADLEVFLRQVGNGAARRYGNYLRGEDERPVVAAELEGSRDEPAWRVRALEILREVGRPLHYTVLLGRLRDERVLTLGRNPEATFLSYLSRNLAFQRAGKGAYWIAGEPIPPRAEADEPSEAPAVEGSQPMDGSVADSAPHGRHSEAGS